MSDIRFNQWLHNSGTGGVSQVDGGHVGIGTTNPLIPVGSGNTAILNVGVVTASTYYGDGSNLSGIVGGGTSLSFNDNIGAYFGNSQDLKIYHDGNHSYIDDQGTGNLRLRSGTLEILNLAGNKTSAIFSSGGAQTLNFNNNTKFATQTNGITVTGGVYSDGLICGDSDQIELGDSGDLSIYHNGSNGYIKNSTGQQLYRSATHTFENAAGSSEYVRISSSGKVNIGDNQTSQNILNIEDGTAASMEFASHGTGGDTAYIGVKKSTGGGLTFGVSNRDIIFKTGASYSGGTAFDGGTERLRITSGGNLRLGLNSVAEQTDSAHYIMTLTGKSGQTGAGAIAFKDPSANTDGFIFADGGNLFITADYSNATADSSIRFRVDGSSERARISSEGYVTKPAHPAFFVTMNGGDQTTAASNILPFDTVVHNNGGHYKTSGSNIYHFVCPVAGYYFFGGQVWLKHGAGTGNHARWEIWRDSTIVALAGWHQQGVNLGDHQSSATVTIYCDAGAKVYMEADFALSYWRGSPTNPHTFFHGHLIG